MILAPGLDEKRCAAAAELMPNIRKRLGKGLPTNHDNATANDMTLARAVLCSVREDAPNAGKATTKIAKSAKNEERDGDDPPSSTAAADLLSRPMPFPPRHYALSPKQMVEMDYPTPTLASRKDGEATPNRRSSSRRALSSRNPPAAASRARRLCPCSRWTARCATSVWARISG
jgi:hypothetical protein